MVLDKEPSHTPVGDVVQIVASSKEKNNSLMNDRIYISERKLSNDISHPRSTSRVSLPLSYKEKRRIGTSIENIVLSRYSHEVIHLEYL